MKRKLVILMYDNLDVLISKGEEIDRYYNPNNFFNEVYFFLINQKRIFPKKLNKMCGNAKVFVYNYDISFLEKLFLFFNLNSFLTNTQKIIVNAKKINADLVRCYNINFQIFILDLIKKKIQIPSLVSIHYDLQSYLKKKNIIFRVIFNLRIPSILKRANVILPVYNTATEYLKNHKIKNYQICYNFINPKINKVKKKKNTTNVMRLICTNRQFSQKNPINIIKSLKYVDNAKLTLVGDGPLHTYLRNQVKVYNLHYKINFIKKIKNDEYINFLSNFDIFICSTNINEFSKGMIEAIALGMPIIVNKQETKIKELTKNFSVTTNDDPISYFKSIYRFIKNKDFYNKLSKGAKKMYLNKYHNIKCEKKFALIFKSIILKSSKNK